MGNTFGRQFLDSTGLSPSLSADGKPEVKVGGITVDWSTVDAVSGSNVSLPHGIVVYVGEKYLRVGQLMCLIGGAEVQTVTYTGGPTAGNATITFPAFNGDDAVTLTPLPFNATALAMQAALEAVPRIGAGRAVVARSGAGSAGDPYIYTITFARGLGDVPQLTSTHTFTGGTSPTTTHATTTPGTGTGKYGPYDSAASDGRATIARGEAFWCNQTVKEEDIRSNHPQVMYGGVVWKERLLATNGSASKTAGPTFANVETYFPRLVFLANN